MNMLRRLFGGAPDKVDDPVLGPLTQRDGHWTGQMTWAHSPAPFALTVQRAKSPDAADHAAFEQLRRHYPAMRSALQVALFELWNARPTSGDPAPGDFGSAFDLWASVQLQGVGLQSDGRAELIYGFSGPGLPEGAFIVSAHGQDVEPVEYVE